MASHHSLNVSLMYFGPYTVQFVDNQLHVALASDPITDILYMDAETTLDLANWLALYRKTLFAIVMRDRVEALKAQVRAEYDLIEPEERAIYVPPSSCNETLMAFVQVADVTLHCDSCQKPLCLNCSNCHNRRCRYFIDQKHSHRSE